MRISQQVFLLIFVALLIATLFGFFIWKDLYFLNLTPIGLMLLFFLLYQTEKLFLAIAFFTPLSINIEEISKSFGLFIPSEPLLFGLMLFLTAIQIKMPFLNPKIWKHPIVISIIIFLFWIIVTSITSSNPYVSFKYFLSKLWFFVPVLIFGTHFFKKDKNKLSFFWLFITAVSITIVYTLFQHASYNFGEKEGHWVMFPFFKDHTIYGAVVALILPLAITLYFYKKYSLLVQSALMLIITIILLGLFFSYTRAAWLSIVLATIVGALIYFRVNYKLLAFIGITVLGFLFFQWDKVEMELARNKYEHTTESIDERIQSVANVTTDASNLERINRWSCAIAMFKERPIFGYGPGTYAFEYAPFQKPENLTIISTNFGDMGNAHSEYLGVLSEMGFIGLILFLIILVSIYYSGIKLYYRFSEKRDKNKLLVMGILISLTTYFTHAFLNNFLDTDKAAVPIWGMCAMLVAWKIQLDEELSSNP